MNGWRERGRVFEGIDVPSRVLNSSMEAFCRSNVPLNGTVPKPSSRKAHTGHPPYRPWQWRPCTPILGGSAIAALWGQAGRLSMSRGQGGHFAWTNPSMNCSSEGRNAEVDFGGRVPPEAGRNARRRPKPKPGRRAGSAPSRRATLQSDSEVCKTCDAVAMRTLRLTFPRQYAGLQI